MVMGPAVGVWGQQHRATRLGDPAHRFAKPLQTPDDLRRLFADPGMRADVASILEQVGWRGDVEDLRLAAATAEVVAVKLPTGTRLPFMSSRNRGKPVALVDVLWAGKRPIDAYEFEFVSRGWRYRCVTPKACANFLVVDLGPAKEVRLVRRAPVVASLCEPFEVVMEVRNGGGAALTQVVVEDVLASCVRAADGRGVVRFELGTLRPGEVREVRYWAQAASVGRCEGRARVTTAEGVSWEAAGEVEVKAPVLAVDCELPGEVLPKRPIEACVRVRNAGSVAEPRVAVALVIPAGARVVGVRDGGRVEGPGVVWEFSGLGAGVERSVCATFVVDEPGVVGFAARVAGQCAPAVETRCRTQVAGIPAILLEVVDLSDPVEVGGEVTYEIRVTNQGSAVGTQLRWVGLLAEGQEYVTGSGPTRVLGEGRRAEAEPLATLAPKAQAVWRVVVKATAAADARFKVELTSDQFPRPVEEWEATSQY